MLQNFVFIYFVLGAFLLLFYTPSVFTRGIFKLEYNELTMREKLLSWVPVLNIATAETLYTGKRSLVAVSNAFLVFTIVTRLIAARFITDVTMVQIITILLFLGGIVFFFIANMILIFIILSDTKVLRIPTMVLFTIVFPLGQYYIGTFLPTVLKNVGKDEDTF